jgi:hypothetical protein
VDKISVLILTPNRAKTAAGNSYLMQVVYEHLPLAQQIDMQLVKRRWFREYGPALLAPITTYTPKLLRLFCNSACIEVFSPTHLAWEQVFVSTANENLQAAREYFEGKDQYYHTESKITPLCHSRILITGGYSPSLLPYEYAVGQSAILVNLACNSVEEKPQMTQGRYRHSVAIVGNMTYVIAGYDQSTDWPVTSVERYDVISERWSTLTA